MTPGANTRRIITRFTCGAGSTNPSGAHEFTPCFCGVLVIRFAVLCICFVCPFVLFLLTIVLSVLLRFTDYDYHFGIFKLFSINCG